MAKIRSRSSYRNIYHLPLFRSAMTRQPVKHRTYAESRLAQRCRLASPHLASLFAELAGFPREGGNDS